MLHAIPAMRQDKKIHIYFCTLPVISEYIKLKTMSYPMPCRCVWHDVTVMGNKWEILTIDTNEQCIHAFNYESENICIQNICKPLLWYTEPHHKIFLHKVAICAKTPQIFPPVNFLESKVLLIEKLVNSICSVFILEDHLELKYFHPSGLRGMA